MGVNGAVAGLVALATLAAGAAPAGPSTGRVFATRVGSDAQVSSNWAGYALAGTNPDTTPVTYTNVTGTWVQPKATCAAGESYSAFWVGLGGFAADSQALEQIGTESNCTASGRAVYAAWYEILPAPSIPIRMKIRPGDRITTAVLVQGTQVILQITNRTTHVRVTKRATVAAPDLTSAEWIAEAPSECSSCRPVPDAAARELRGCRVHRVGRDRRRACRHDQRSRPGRRRRSSSPRATRAASTYSCRSHADRLPALFRARFRPTDAAFSVAWHPASA